jgi:hypothetical protein
MGHVYAQLSIQPSEGDKPLAEFQTPSGAANFCQLHFGLKHANGGGTEEIVIFPIRSREDLSAWEQELSDVVDGLREATMEIDRRDPEVTAETAKIANVEPLPELEMVPMPVDFPGYVTDPISGASVPVSPSEVAEGQTWQWDGKRLLVTAVEFNRVEYIEIGTGRLGADSLHDFPLGRYIVKPDPDSPPTVSNTTKLILAGASYEEAVAKHAQDPEARE